MSVKNGQNREYKRDEKGRFIKGTAPGPGRKHRDFFTDFKQAAKEIAQKLGIKDKKKEERIYIELMKQGIKSGLKGNYNFWRDLADRIYGKQTEKVDLTTGGEQLGVIILPAKQKKDENSLEATTEAGNSFKQD